MGVRGAHLKGALWTGLTLHWNKASIHWGGNNDSECKSVRAAGAGKVSGGRGNGSSEKWCASCLCSGSGELGREKA